MTTNKAKIPFQWLVGALLLFVALGCNTAPDTGAEYSEEANDAAVLTAEERAERREALSRKWEAAEDRLEELRARATADGIENEVDEAVAEMDREAAELERELDEFGDDSRVAWNNFEERVERHLDELGREIDEAAAYFE